MSILRIKEVLGLDEGTSVSVDGSIKSFEIRKSTKGSDFADIILADNENEIFCKIWNISEATKTFLMNNTFVRVSGTTNVFNDVKQIIITRVFNIPEAELDESKLQKTAPESVDSLVAYLENCINDIQDEVVKTVVSRRWNKNKDKFVKWPAAKSNHHDYVTGLLYHTVSMLRLATNNLQQYPGKLDIDVLYGGIILHDMDKIREYSAPEKPKFTELGELYGHIFMSGAETYCEARDLYKENPDLNFDKVKYLIHAILSHHGKLEWGSPVVPKTIEAEIIHQIDMMDSRMNMKF